MIVDECFNENPIMRVLESRFYIIAQEGHLVEVVELFGVLD